MENFISTESVAKDLDCSKRTVQHWINTGKLKAEKLFGRWLVDRAYYNEWKKRHLMKKDAAS